MHAFYGRVYSGLQFIMVAPSRQLPAIGQWEEYCNIQMGRPAKTSTWRAIKGVNPFESHQPCCPAQAQGDLPHQNYGPQLSEAEAIRFTRLPSLCPMRRLIDIRSGSETHGSPSYPTAQYASLGAFISYFCSILGFPDRGSCVRESKLGNEAILCCLRAQIGQLHKRESDTKRSSNPRISTRSLM